MEIKNAFEYIAGKVEAQLAPAGYTRQKVAADDKQEIVALFTSENVAYSVVYYKEKTHMVLRTCTMTEEGPDNEWKTLATWMLDEESTQKDVESISNDFIEGVSGAVAVKRAKQIKQKKKKDDDGNADPKFLAKRFVAVFPELKEEIKYEEDGYFPFRGATFAKEKIAPKIVDYVKSATKPQLEKLVGIFNLQYNNGDVDTRSIITIVLLNALDDEQFNTVFEYLSDDLKSGSFNPLLPADCNISADDSEKIKELKEKAEPILNTCICEAALAFELIEFRRFSSIIGNIIYRGLENVQNKIIFKNENKKVEKEGKSSNL